MRTKWVATTVVLAATVMSCPAWGDDRAPSARELLARGAREEKGGELVASKGSFEEAMERAHADGDAALERLAKASLDKLRRRLPGITLSMPRGAELERVTVDGAEAVRDGPTVYLDPGTHDLVVEASGFAPYERLVKVAEGEQLLIEPELVRPAPPDDEGAELVGRGENPPPTASDPWAGPPPAETQPSLLPLIPIGVGVAAMGVGAGMWIAGRGGESDVEEACGGTTGCDPSLQSEQRAAEHRIVIGNVAFLVGAGLAAVGGGWLAVELILARPRDHAGIRLVPLGTGLGAVGRF